MPRQVALKASMQPWTVGILKQIVLLGRGLSAGNFDCVVIRFLFSYIFIFLNPPSRWCRLATIKCSKAFLALKPLYCDQSTKLTQLIKPNYFVILLYWYNTSFLRKLLLWFSSVLYVVCYHIWFAHAHAWGFIKQSFTYRTAILFRVCSS